MSRKSRGDSFYLDSSVFFASAFGHELQKMEIARSIGSARRISCTYAFTEIKNHARAFIDFYIILHDENSVPDAFAVVNSFMADRFPSKVISVLGQLFVGTRSKAHALARLATVIQAYIDKCYLLVGDRLIDDGLGCPLSNATFSTEPGLTTYEMFLRFKQALKCEVDDPPKCEQDSFRHNNARSIELIRTDPSPTHDGTKNLQGFLSTLTPYGRKPHARGLKYRCSKLGDMLISLQCPKNATLVTLDGSFADYGRILGFKVNVVPSLNALRNRRTK